MWHTGIWKYRSQKRDKCIEFYIRQNVMLIIHNIPENDSFIGRGLDEPRDPTMPYAVITRTANNWPERSCPQQPAVARSYPQPAAHTTRTIVTLNQSSWLLQG